MPSLRSPEGEKRYKEYLQTHAADEVCALCERQALQEFTYWKIIDNAFPYDLIASKHHMLVPIEHVFERELSEAEKEELETIKTDIVHTEYDWIIEATHKNKSIPGHFHVHLLVAKPREAVVLN